MTKQTKSDSKRLRDGLIVAAASLLIVALLLFLLRELRLILQPLFVAVFLCYLIVPAHRWLVQHRLPSSLSYFVIVGIFVSLMSSGGCIAYNGVTKLTSNLANDIQQLDELIQTKIHDYKHRLSSWTSKNDTSESDANEPVPATQQAATTPTTAPSALTKWMSSGRLFSMAGGLVDVFVGFSTSVFVILFYLVFLLAETASFQTRVINAFGHERSSQVMSVVNTINTAVSRYIAVKTLVSLAVGASSALILYAFGVKYAFVWGLLTFLANYIPYIGSFVAVLFPVALSLVQFSGDLGKTTLLALMLLAAQVIVGSVIEPRIVGKQLGVSPLVIMLALAFWGFVWGIPGMILSAPLAVSIKIVLENIDQTRPLGRLLSTA